MTILATKPLASIENDGAEVVFVSPTELRDILILRKGSFYVSFNADYDMTAKGKMNKKSNDKTTANPFFATNLRKVSTYRSQLANFDYDKALQRRSDGDEAATGGSSQQRVIAFDDGKPYATALTVQKSDILATDENGAPTVFAENARVRLNFEPTLNKIESRYYDDNGEVDTDTVKSFLGNRKRSTKTVKWLTVALDNLTEIRFDGTVYRIRK